jgi:flagellar hook-associated protein FlgK
LPGGELRDVHQRDPEERLIGPDGGPDQSADGLGQHRKRQHARLCAQGHQPAATGRGWRGAGVEITGVARVTDQYLQLASLTAASETGRWDITSEFLDNAQSLFGDPSEDGFFFNRLDEIFANFAGAADDPSSSLLRTQAVSSTQDFLGEADRINTQLTQLGATVDTQIGDNVSRANSLLSQISKLNSDISRAKIVNADSSGSENIQAQLVDELSGLMSIKIDGRPTGGVTIRSPEGVTLAGDTAAVLTYVRTDTTRGYIAAQTGTAGNPQPIQVNSGEIRGLLDLRDDRLPALSDQLGEFMSRAAERLNAAHNASTSFPAPASLTGRDTGLDMPTAISGFTGKDDGRHRQRRGRRTAPRGRRLRRRHHERRRRGGGRVYAGELPDQPEHQSRSPRYGDVYRWESSPLRRPARTAWPSTRAPR